MPDAEHVGEALNHFEETAGPPDSEQQDRDDLLSVTCGNNGVLDRVMARHKRRIFGTSIRV